MLLHILLTALGFAMLYFGAEWLVRGAAGLALRLGISSVVIGLTVVAFGTSAPELVISVVSSLSDKSMIAVGNVVGSNICNTTLVLGIAAFLMPAATDRSVIRRDIPLMLGISVFLVLLSLNSVITRIEGVILFTGIILYIYYNYARFAKTRPDLPDSGIQEDSASPPVLESGHKQVFFVVIGIALVVIGAQVLVNSVVAIMEFFQVSEKFVGLTVVAIGTSLPELATSVVAAMRREMDISIGNLVGSNVFNILSVIGAAAMVRPITIPGGFIQSGMVIDYAVMLLAGIVPWLLMRKRLTLHRSGGAVLIMMYIAYFVYLTSTI